MGNENLNTPQDTPLQQVNVSVSRDIKIDNTGVIGYKALDVKVPVVIGYYAGIQNNGEHSVVGYYAGNQDANGNDL